MTYHRFLLSDSSFSQIKEDQSDLDANLNRYTQFEGNEGYSAEDWAKRLGFGKKKTQKVLKDWLYEGKCRVLLREGLYRY